MHDDEAEVMLIKLLACVPLNNPFTNQIVIVPLQAHYAVIKHLNVADELLIVVIAVIAINLQVKVAVIHSTVMNDIADVVCDRD